MRNKTLIPQSTTYKQILLVIIKSQEQIYASPQIRKMPTIVIITIAVGQD